MIPPSHQLPPGPERALLSEGREMKALRLVHSLYTSLATVRRTKSPEELLRSIHLTKELNSLGFAAVVIQKGRITGAEDRRFQGKEISLPSPSPKDTPASSTQQWLRYQEILRQFDQLDEPSQRQLLRELRMARASQMKGEPNGTRK